MTLEERLASYERSLHSLTESVARLNRARKKLDILAGTSDILLTEVVAFLEPEKLKAWGERRTVIEREARQRYLEFLENEDPGLAAQFDDRPESETKDLDG